ncbi:MAG: tetratricopeptide repeat protein, partial [Hydrogenovibrio sp.]|nr:tetratricopeptide repeat protein [Hydrogenovibrio sp.]
FGYQHLVQTAGKSRVLIVFTNGEPENYQAQPLPENLKKIAQSGTKVILVGVGETAASRVPDFNDRTGYLHANGILVTSRLEAVSMQKLAGQVGGQYLHASKDANFIQALLKAISLEAEKRHFQSSQPVWQDHAMPFIWTALVALLWAFFPIRGRLQRKSNLASAYWGVGLVLCFVAGGSALHSGEVEAAEPNVSKHRQAYDAFASKNYDLSQQLYDEMNDYQGWFGAGDAAYRAEDYESAVLYFRQAALMGRNDRQRAESLYNLGNTYYQTNLLDQAIEAYEQALVYQPDYPKAKHNLELAKQRRAVERKGQQQRDESGEGQGKGSQSRDADGSFYGGQKPNSDPGEGVAGESPEGNKQAKDFVLPSDMEETDFRLKSMQRLQANDTASAILDQQQRIRRIEKFEQKMEQVDDNQSELLIRLFEREEGFQARQDESHDLPGVKPW